MGTMTDQQIVEKSLEAQHHVEALNSIMRELAFEGCRVDADVSDLHTSQIGQWENKLPVLPVDVYRRISV